MSDDIVVPLEPLTHQRLVEAHVLIDAATMSEWCWVGPRSHARCKAAFALQERKMLERVRDEPPCWHITMAGKQALRGVVLDLTDYWYDTKGVQNAARY